MKPTGSPAPAATRTAPAPPAPDPVFEFWYLRIPLVLRRFSALLSDIWYDGAYLAFLSRAVLLLPILAFVFGLVEGYMHLVIFNPIQGISTEFQPISFTELFPLMIIATAVGTLSANAGLLLVVGYGLGDLAVTQNTIQQTAAQFGLSDTSSTSILLNVFVPHVLSYYIFFLLAVMPTMSARYLPSAIKGTGTSVVLIRQAVGAIIQALLVYVWTLGTPLAIRTFWGWGWQPTSPPLAGIIYVQTMGNALVQTAILAAIARAVLTYFALRNLQVGLRARRFLQAIAHQRALLQQMPAFVSAVIAAGVITLLTSGMLATTTEALAFFVILAALLVVQNSILPRFGPWTAWSKVITQIPLVVRLAGAALLSYFVVQWILNLTATQQVAINTATGSFQFMLISLCVSLVIVIVLIPRPAAKKSLS